MQNGLRNSNTLQHPFGKFSQLHALHLWQADTLQCGFNAP